MSPACVASEVRGGGCGDYLWKSVQLGSDSRVEFISLVSGFAIELGGSCGSWTQRYIGCDCRRVLKVVWVVFSLRSISGWAISIQCTGLLDSSY